jgi:heme exporter protein D
MQLFDFGPHAAFIWWSYGIVALVIGGLIAWLRADGRRIQAQLDALEARGIRRRSAGPPDRT